MARRQAALVQLAVFLGGGVLGPVLHLARHRDDHTHGPEGRAIAFPIGPDEGTSQAHVPRHAHPHRHGEAGHPQAAAVPTTPSHGHGSISHLGLALLGAPALLATPLPEPAEWLPAGARTAALRLFRPTFPLPRPPPARPA